jgi:hypothetical protein
VSKAVVRVTVVQTKLADGVQYPTPAVEDELVAVGAFALVTVVPPAVYPVPDTSLVEEYTVVDAFNVAVVTYKAALNVSAVLAERAALVELKLCPADSNCPRNDVHIDWVFAMLGSLCH